MELAESFADCLLDHFTERGLLAKEIKVAEIVEMEEEEGMEAADATDTADTTGGWNAAEDFTALYSAADFSNPYPAATEQDTQDDLMAYNSPPAQMRRPKNVFPKKLTLCEAFCCFFQNTTVRLSVRKKKLSVRILRK